MRFARVWLVSVALVFAFGLLACSGEPLQFSEADAGMTQFLRDGQKAILTLELSTDSDFVWQIDIEDETIVEVVDKDLQMESNDLAGGTMKRIYTFKARNSGKTTVTAILVRPTELTKPERTVTFNLEVL
ncbi:MAG TPA: protease inhibitor I42 family protein [bacterium]|nr:protease inhibitor I42 family protein [bacterium]